MIQFNSDSKNVNILKTVGLYVTPCRIAILETMSKAQRPLSGEKLSRLLGTKTFDKVTIYRCLESFCKAGLLHKAYIDKRAVYFELAHNCSQRQCHPHFTCTSCGSTHCMVGMNVPMVKTTHKGFIIQRQKIRLEGICPGCRKKINKESFPT